MTRKKGGDSREPDLTLQEAADLLGVHYMTAYRYVRTAGFPARTSERIGTCDTPTSTRSQPRRRPAAMLPRAEAEKDYLRR